MRRKTSVLLASVLAVVMCFCACTPDKTNSENGARKGELYAIYEKDGALFMTAQDSAESVRISEGEAEGNVSVSDDGSKIFFREKGGAFYVYDAASNTLKLIAENTLDAVGLDSGEAAFYIEDGSENLFGYKDSESFKIASGVKSFAFDKAQEYVFYQTDSGIGALKTTEKREGSVTDGREKISYILKDEDGNIDAQNPYIVDIEKGELKKFSSDFQSLETVSEGYVVNAMIHGGVLYVFKQASEADEYGRYLTNLYSVKDGGEELCAAGISGTECSNIIYKNKKRLLFVLENAVSGAYMYCSLDDRGSFTKTFPVEGNVSNLFCSDDGKSLFVMNSASVLYEYKIGSDGAYKPDSKKEIAKNVKYAAFSSGVCQIYTTDGFYIYDGKLTKVYKGEQAYANVEKDGESLVISDKFANGPMTIYKNGALNTVLESVSDYRLKSDGSIFASVMRKNENGVFVCDLKKVSQGGTVTDITDNITRLLY